MKWVLLYHLYALLFQLVLFKTLNQFEKYVNTDEKMIIEDHESSAEEHSDEEIECRLGKMKMTDKH